VRVYISVDLEGVNGVCHSSHTQPGEPHFERAVGLMHAETNAVIRGARAGGATDVCVNDSHWDMRNLRPELLEPGTTIVSGWQKPNSMVSGVGGSSGIASLVPDKFDVAFFVGYHAMAGTARGVLSHTYRAQVFLDIKLNGKSVGETGLNAALAASYGVPIGLITGDDAVCEEATELLKDVPCVAVKKAVSRYSAIFHPYEQTLDELKKAAHDTMKNKSRWRKYSPASPTTMTITMVDPVMADGAELFPMVTRVDDRTVELSHEDYGTLFRLMLAIGAVGASRRDPHF
jgi:D-amino peptidase